MQNTKKSIIGFWGYPNPTEIKKYKELYPNHKWVDLDIDINSPDLKLLPNAYCKIIKNILNNSFYFKNDIELILAPTGKDKCDSGWFAAQILKDNGFKIIETIFENSTYNEKPLISTSNLPLKEKITLITAGIIEKQEVKIEPCKAKFGFWGVPPNDLSILDIFPDETHVFGWTRAVEMMRPADIELEMYVDENIPTVFYAQAFCAKAQLAKYLANKYNGLYVDIDDDITNSTKAKIEAFLRLR